MQQGIRKSLIDSLSDLSKKIKIEKNDDRPGHFVVVFNSLPWEVKDWTEADLEFDKGIIRGIANLKTIVNDKTMITMVHQSH